MFWQTNFSLQFRELMEKTCNGNLPCLATSSLYYVAVKSAAGSIYDRIQVTTLGLFVLFIFLRHFIHFMTKKNEKIVLVSKNWFQPANGLWSTCSLVKIHNSFGQRDCSRNLITQFWAFFNPPFILQDLGMLTL